MFIEWVDQLIMIQMMHTDKKSRGCDGERGNAGLEYAVEGCMCMRAGMGTESQRMVESSSLSLPLPLGSKLKSA